jgi:hypothetical protein
VTHWAGVILPAARCLLEHEWRVCEGAGLDATPRLA